MAQKPKIEMPELFSEIKNIIKGLTDQQFLQGHRKTKSVDLSICQFWSLNLSKSTDGQIAD
jgi:hypothetical protein